MRVLALNSGSSSLKFKLFEVARRDERAGLTTVVAGQVSGIGSHTVLDVARSGASPLKSERVVKDHYEAAHWVFEQVAGEPIGAVGHRVVHGGDVFVESVRIDVQALAKIEQLNDLAPLHNPACVAGITVARTCLGERVPMVAVFDTAFHLSMPAHASTYALPFDLAHRYRIRRYGFHGIAHGSLAARYAAFRGTPLERVALITLHLGNGCSAAAIRNGRSIDTSMGFTPLEGLVMGTRSGDLDPALVSYLARREGIDIQAVERLLNEQSGLQGLSGLSHDMAALLAAEKQQHQRAKLALQIFCYRARKYIGAYLAALSGAEAVIFSGGIGEHAPAIRARICEGMEWCGLHLDHDRNASVSDVAAGDMVRISRDGAGIAVYVAAVDEETEIAQETERCIRTGDAQ